MEARGTKVSRKRGCPQESQLVTSVTWRERICSSLKVCALCCPSPAIITSKMSFPRYRGRLQKGTSGAIKGENLGLR